MGPDSPKSAGAEASDAKDAGETLYSGLLDTVLTGIAILIPLLVTLYILSIALDFVYNVLQPIVGLFEWAGLIDRLRSYELVVFLVDLGVYTHIVGVLTELITLVVLFLFVLVVGTLGRNRFGERLVGYVDLAITAVPGIGTVYKSFRRMGDVMLNDNAENFQEVKLVQCLDEDVYVLGFRTSESPPSIETATGHEDMIAMFLPLAPNPVTGGFLAYIPEENVYDIDMTIEDGVRSILTSGIATGEGATERSEVTMGDLSKIADVENLQDALTPEDRTQDDSPDGDGDR